VIAALPSWLQDLGALGAVVIALGGAGTVIYRGVRGMFHHAVEEIDQRIERKIAPVLAELSPNGGSSTRDAIDRMEFRLAIIEKIVKVDAAASETERQDDAERRS